MRAFVLTALMAAGLATATASTASAQVGIHVGPGGAGVYVNPGYGHGGPPRVYEDYGNDYGNWRVSRNEAVRIARRNGMAEIFDVERSPRAWIVRGVNFRGRRVAMRIDRNGGWSW
jgi:hypothetical protein